MKRQIIALTSAITAIAVNGLAQGTFVNLGFESANVAPLPPGQGEVVSASDAFPGWSFYRGNQLGSQAIHNDLSAGSSSTSILGPFYQPLFGGPGIIDGSFTAVLQPGAFTGGGVSVSLAQTAQIPLSANSLLFKVAPSNTNIMVGVGGQTLSLMRLQSTPTYDVYGAAVSPFAGQIAELRFTGLWFEPPDFGFPVYLDAIQFSANSVPEPSTWALLGLGSALFWSTVRRRRK